MRVGRKSFNLKQMAKAMMFMEEHGIKSYAELKEKGRWNF